VKLCDEWNEVETNNRRTIEEKATGLT